MDDIYKNRVRKMRVVPEPEVVVSAGTVVIDANEIHLNGWKLKWRDWVYLGNQDAKIGTWIAYPIILEGWGLYSSYPGNCGPFLPGSVLDCAQQDWQTLPTLMCSASDLEQFKQEALQKLKELIWQVGSPPYNPYAVEREEAV